MSKMLANNKYFDYTDPDVDFGSINSSNGGNQGNDAIHQANIRSQQLEPLPSDNVTKSERESIHSGQFMVSTFEAEEAQDDLIDDAEIKMLDPEDPSLSKPDEDDTNGTCLEVQLYVPHRRHQSASITYELSAESAASGRMAVTSQLEIETSLTKLFKCMNLAYSQKLTSPKWNSFKGVRLRWKDKIRLNNVIWRCWHMQFILKRRTPVCQFASPLDVDIHNNPQSIVLEGKYWKRQLVVIKAEYRKWRRNFKSQIVKSELDILEWPPINDKSLVISEDWTTDTLFSTINVPFPFPDSREIARGVSIADFIQPSLGPLQPNLDDIDLSIVELLQNPYLPPVPEEGNTEDILKSADYDINDILGDRESGINTQNIVMNVADSNVVLPQIPENSNNVDVLLELGNTSLNSMQYSTANQQLHHSQLSQFLPIDNNLQLLNSNNKGRLEPMLQTENDIVMNEAVSSENIQIITTNSLNSLNTLNQKMGGRDVTGAASNFGSTSTVISGRQNFTDYPVKKGHVLKTSQGPFRRQPHNYDKPQSSVQQTTIYQQLLAEQQKQQQHFLTTNNSTKQNNYIYSGSSSALNSPSIVNQHQYQTSNVAKLLNNVNDSFYVNVNSTNASDNHTISTQIGSSDGGPQLIANNNVMNAANSSTDQIHLSFSQQRNNDENDVMRMFNFAFAESDNNTFDNRSNINNFDLLINNTNNASNVNALLKTTETAISSTVTISPEATLPSTIVASPLKKSTSIGSLINLQTTSNSNNPLIYFPMEAGVNNHHHHHQQQQQQHSNMMQFLAQIQSIGAYNQQQGNNNINMDLMLSTGNMTQQQSDIVNSNNLLTAKETQSSNSLPINVTLHSPKSNAEQQQYNIENIYNNNNNSNHLEMARLNNPLPLTKSTRNYSVNNLPMRSIASLETTESSNILDKNNIATMSWPMPEVSKCLTLTTLPSEIGTTTVTGTSAVIISTSTAIMATANSSISTNRSPMITMDDILKSKNSLPLQTNIIKTNNQSNNIVYNESDIIDNTSSSMNTSINKMLNKSYVATNMMNNHEIGNTSGTSTQLNLSSDSIGRDASMPSGTISTTLSNVQIKSGTRDNQRRVGHTHAEQKRRYNIKNGFDQLRDLLPRLQNSSSKLTKAVMLQKSAEHIKQLKNERDSLRERIAVLRTERDNLNNSLSNLHLILPANGAPVSSRQDTENVRKMFEQYVKYRSQDNWKFWILGLIMEPLLTTFTSTVSSASLDELRRTAFLWIDQHCSMIDLRPAITNKLRYLSMTTDILADPPSSLQEEVIKAINNSSSDGQHPNISGN